jgi:hypothetical protein
VAVVRANPKPLQPGEKEPMVRAGGGGGGWTERVAREMSVMMFYV